MASGQVVGIISAVMPPATVGALYGVRVGGSTPAEQVPYWAFDAAADNYLDFYGTLAGYGGGGLTCSLKWMAASATTAGVLWALGIRAIPDDTEDVDTAQTYDYNEIRDVCATVSGEYAYATITFVTGADMDGLLDGQDFILRLRRRGSDNTASTGDDMAGFAQAVSLTVRET